MARRRGKGEGSISRRADGRWQARVDMGRGTDGKRRRKTLYGDTRAAVASELNRLLGRSESGELLVTSTPTVATWLRSWHRTHAVDWRPSTRRVYRIAVEDWLIPVFGKVRLEKLTPAAIQQWVNEATAAGPSARVVLAHTVLRTALRWAMTQRVLTFNAAALVRVPRPTPTRPAPLSADQARALLAAAEGHRLGPLVVVALSLGLRIGEVSGLAWGDVQVEARTLKVRQQVQAISEGPPTLTPLKTASSRRTLALPTLVVDALKAHRKRQQEERLKAGADWKPTADLVFTTPTGRALHPTHVRDVLAELLEAAGLPRVKFHTLRHTAATLLLTDGTPLFDVSRILGHSQIRTTADTYGHLVEDMTAGAAARMDALLAKRRG